MNIRKLSKVIPGLFIIALSLILFLGGCGSGGGIPSGGEYPGMPTTTPTGSSNVKEYNAAESRGDLLTYTIDFDALTYSYRNITTGEEKSGTFSWNDDGTATLDDGRVALMHENGVIMVSDGNEFSAVGVPDLDSSYSSNIDGEYNYINASGHHGSITIDYANRTYTWEDLYSGDKGSGTYTDNQDGLLNMTDASDSSTPGRERVAMILPDEMIVIDEGLGNGMIAGVKKVTGEYSFDISGTYLFVVETGERGKYILYPGTDQYFWWKNDTTYGTGYYTDNGEGILTGTDVTGSTIGTVRKLMIVPGKVVIVGDPVLEQMVISVKLY